MEEVPEEIEPVEEEEAEVPEVSDSPPSCDIPHEKCPRENFKRNPDTCECECDLVCIATMRVDPETCTCVPIPTEDFTCSKRGSKRCSDVDPQCGPGL